MNLAIHRDSSVHLLTPSNITIDALGKRKKFGGLTRWEWLFLVVSTVNILASIALSLYRLIIVVKDEKSSPDFTFTILLIINSVFCLFYAVHGLLKELKYEIYVFMCAASALLLYCIIEYIINIDKRSKLKLVRLIAACILGPINIALAAKVAYEFGWLEFRIIGASAAMQRMYHTAAGFTSLLEFDLQATVSFLVLALNNQSGVFEISQFGILVLSIGVPLACALALLGNISMNKEWKLGIMIFSLVGLAAPAYVIYIVVYDYQHWQSGTTHTADILLSYLPLIVGSILLLVRGIVYFELYVVYKNFDKGLRQRAFESDANERTGLLAR